MAFIIIKKEYSYLWYRKYLYVKKSRGLMIDRIRECCNVDFAWDYSRFFGLDLSFLVGSTSLIMRRFFQEIPIPVS